MRRHHNKLIRFEAFFMLRIALIAVLYQEKTAIAYEQYCTHPTITERAADIFSRVYGVKFNSSTMQKLREGSTHEDNGIINYLRSTNHFYDIHNMQPWTNHLAASAASVVLRSPCFEEADRKSFIVTSKDWAFSASNQQRNWTAANGKSCSYDGDYSWNTILMMIGENKPTDEIAYAAGHILHLIQDLTVPAHTRNDTHYPTNEDELEIFAKNHCWNIQSANVLIKDGLVPVSINKLDTTFDELATYTYSHYFSRDTKYHKDYDLPKETRRATVRINGSEHTFIYATDESSVKYGLPSEYLLAEVQPWMERFFPNSPNTIYKLTDDVMEDYWARTQRKAIAYSAGALKKLSDEATARGKCFPSCPTMNPTPCTGKPDKRYCGSSLSGYTGNASDLVTCRGGMPLGNSACPNGCQSNPPGTDDTCKTGPCTTYYLDQDGDGHGDKFQPGKCQMGPSAPYTAANNDDCSDTDRDVYPGHTEWWDVKDNDCDGSIDEDGLLRYDRWHKEWTPTDLEHRFSVSSPGSGFTKESRWVQLYPTDVCSGGYKAPGCNPIRSGVYAEVRSGVQLAALGECTGQFRSAPFAHVTLYLLEDSTEYNDYATGIVPGFACRRFGYVLGSGATAAFFGKKAFNRLRSKFDVGGRYDNLWSTDLSEANHSDYATFKPEDTRHWYAPDGL